MDQKRSEFSIFAGSLGAIIGTATTAIVIAYIHYTFWMQKAFDLNIKFGDQNLPPQSYPILLLVIWTITQREKAHSRPKDGGLGTFWAFEDRWEAILATAYLGVTLVWSLATQSNLSFAVPLAAFVIQSIYDAIRNGTHKYAGEVAKAALGMLPIDQLPEKVTRTVKVVVDPQYFYKHPTTGEEIPWNPRQLIGQQGASEPPGGGREEHPPQTH